MNLKSLVAFVATAGVVAAGCSSSSPTTAARLPEPTRSSTTTTTKLGGPFSRPACVPKASAPVVASRVPGSSADYDIVSFDGTKIRVHWFPRSGVSGSKSPTVLKGPGWGSPGDVDTTSAGYGLFGDLSIRTLRLAGYNVLTWDPRGFGKSGGTVEVDSPEFEGRDVEPSTSSTVAVRSPAHGSGVAPGRHSHTVEPDVSG